MVPVISGANKFDLTGSAARNNDELFALFGLLESQARALYDPKGTASLDALIQTIIADRNMVEPSRNLAELTTKADEFETSRRSRSHGLYGRADSERIRSGKSRSQ
jgi:para-nitrobenzyl esterase